METKRTYITPVTKNFSPITGMIMQDDPVVFSGGAPDEGIVIIPGADDSDLDNRINSWSNHLWDD